MTGIAIHLFGPARVTAGPEERPVRLGRSPLALLVFLCLHADRPVPREVAGAELWPDCAPERVKSRLSTAIWRLRGALREIAGDEVVLDGDGSTLALAPALAGAVDINRFEVAARAFLAAPDAAPCPCLSGAEGAAEPLAGWYDVWALSARVRLQDLRESCLTLMLVRQVAAGEDAAAAETAEILLAADPLREDVYRILMRLAARQGRPGLLLRQYSRCREILAEELGIEPEAETQALLAQLQNRADPAPCSAGAADQGDRAALVNLRRTLRETQASIQRMSHQLDSLLR